MEQDYDALTLTQSVAEGEEEATIIVDLKTQLEALQSQLEGLQTLTSKNESSWQIKHDEMVVQCESHRSENVTLQDDLSKFKSELEAKIGLHSVLEGKFNDPERQCESLRQNVIDKETIIADLKTQLEALVSSDESSWQVKYDEMVEVNEKHKCENLVLQDILEVLKADLKAKNDLEGSEVEEAQSAGFDAFKQQNDTLTQTVAERETTILDLKSKLESLQMLSTNSESSWQMKHDELTHKLEQYKSENLLLQQSLEKVKSDSEERLKQAIDELQQEKEMNSDNVMNLGKQLQTLKDEIVVQTASFAELTGRFDTLTQTVTEKETTVTGLESKLESLQTLTTNNESSWQVKFDELTHQCEQQKSENLLLQQSQEELKANLESKNILLSDVEERFKQISGELQGKQLNSDMVEDLEKQLQNMKSEMAAQTSRFEDLMQQYKSLTKAATEKETIIADLKLELESLQALKTNSESSWQVKQDELSHQCEQHKSENLFLQETLEKVNGELELKCSLLSDTDERLKQASGELQQEKETNGVTVMGLEKQLQSLKGEMEIQTSSFADLTQQYESLTKTAAEKETVFADLKLELESLQTRTSNSESLWQVKQDELSHQCEQHKSENLLLQETLEKVSGELELKCGLLSDTEERLKQASGELQQAKETNNGTVLDLEKQLQKLKGEIMVHTSSFADLVTQNDGLTQTIMEKETTITGLESKLESLQTLTINNESSWQVKLDELTHQCEQQKSSNLLLQQSQDELKANLESKNILLSDVEERFKQISGELQGKQLNSDMVEDLEKQLHNMKGEMAAQSSRFEDLMQQCESLAKAATEKETIIADLKLELESLQALKTNSESSWQVKQDELSHQCEQHKSENLFLQETLEKVNGELELKCSLLSDTDERLKQASGELQQEKETNGVTVMGLEKQLQTLKGEIMVHTSSFADLVTQNDGLTQTVMEKETTITGLESKLESLQTLTINSESSWQVKLDELTHQCEQQKSSNLLLQQSQEELKANLESKNILLSDVEERFKQISGELQGKQLNSDMVEDLEKQLQNMKGEMAAQSSRFEDLMQQCESLAKAVTEKETIIADMKLELESLQALKTNSESSWQVKQDELSHQCEQHKSENLFLQKTLEKVNGELELKCSLLSDTEERLKQASGELQQEKETNNGIVMGLENQLQTLKGEIIVQTSSFADLVTQNDGLTQTVMEKEIAITGLESKLESSQTLTTNTESSWQVKLDEYTHQCEQQKSEILLLQETLEKVNRDFETKCGLLSNIESKYEHACEDLQGKCYELIMALSEKELNNDMVMGLQKQLQTLKCDMESQVSRYDDLESKWVLLNEDNVNKETTISNTSSLLSESHKNCAQLTQKLKDKEVEFLDLLEAKASLLFNMETKCDQLSQELQDKSYELILSLSEKQLNCIIVSDLKKQVQRLQFEIKTKTDNFNDLESQWTALRERNFGQEQELSATKLVLGEMEGKIESLAQQLQEKDVELHTVASDNKSRADKVSQSQNEMQTLIGELQSRVCSFEEANSALEQTLIEKENFLAQSKLNEQKSDELQAKHETQLLEAHEKIDNFEKEMSVSKADLEAERLNYDKLRREIDCLKSCHHELNSIIKSHETDLEIKGRENSDDKEQCLRYKEQLNVLIEKCSSLEAEVAVCRNNLNENESLTKSYLVEVEEMKIVLEERNKIQEQAENKLALLQQEIAKKNEILAKNETDIKELEGQLDNWRTNVDGKTELGNTTNKYCETEMLRDDVPVHEVDNNLAHGELDSSLLLRQKLECFRKENDALKKERLENNFNEEILKSELTRFKSDMGNSRLCNESFSTQNFEVNEQLWNLTVEKEAVQTQLDQARLELEAFKSKISADIVDGKDAANMKEKLVQSQFDIAELRCQVDYMETEKLAIEEDIGTTKQDNKNLCAALQSIKERNQALEERLQELVTSETNLNKEAIQSSAELSNIQEQFENLHNVLSKTDSTTSKGNTRKVQTSSKNVKLSKRDSKAKLDITNDLRTVTAEKEVLKGKVASLENELYEAKKSLEDTKSMETDQDENMETLPEQDSGSDLQCHLQEIRTEKLNVEIERDDLLQKNKEIAEECQQVQDQNRILEQNIEQFRNAAQDVGNDLRKLHDVIKEQNESLAKKRKEIVAKANEIETLRTDLAELMTKIQEKQKEIDSLTEEVSQMKDELKESKSNAGTLEDVVESLNFEMAGLEDDNSSLTSNLESAQEKIKDLQNELQLAKQSVEEIKKSDNAKANDTDLHDLRNTIDGLKTDNNELRSRLKEMNELEAVLRDDAQSSLKVLNIKSTECEDLILQLAESKSEIAESIEKAILIEEKLMLSQNQLSKLEFGIREKEEKVSTLQEEKENALAESNAKDLKITNLVATNDELRSQLEFKQEELLVISDEKDLLAQQCADEREMCLSLKSDNESLISQLGEKEEKLTTLKKGNDKSKSLECVKASLSAQLKEKQDEIHGLLESQQSTEKQLSEVERHLSDLKKEVKNKDDEIESLSSNLSLISDELHRNKSSKDDANIEIQNLQKDLSDKESRLKQMGEEHQAILSQLKEAAETMQVENKELSRRLLETQSTVQESGKEVVLKWEQRCKELDSDLGVEREKCQDLTEKINALKTSSTSGNCEEITELKSELSEVKKDYDCMREERQQMFQKAKEHKDRADLLTCRIRVLTHMLKKQGKGNSQAAKSDNVVNNKLSGNKNTIVDVESVKDKQCLPETNNVCKTPSKVTVQSTSSLKLSSIDEQSDANKDKKMSTSETNSVFQEKGKITEVTKSTSPISSPSLERKTLTSPSTKKSSPLSLRKRTSKMSSVPNLHVLAESKSKTDSDCVQTTSQVLPLSKSKQDPALPQEVCESRMSTRMRSSSQSSQSSKDISSQGVVTKLIKDQSEPVPRVTRRSGLRKRESSESLPSTGEGKKSKLIYEDPLTWLEGPSKQAKPEPSMPVMKKGKLSSTCDVSGPSTRSKAKETTSKILNPITNSPVKDYQSRPKGFLRQTLKTSERKTQAVAGKDEAAQDCKTQ